MGRPFDRRHETRTAGFYTLVACLGFVTDAALLKGGMALGLPAAWARVVSLSCAMQVTFWVNGLFVFKCLDRKSFHVQWLKYMGSNGVGNLCNYLTFTTLLSLHAAIFSNRWFALTIGSLTAWIINYSCTRFLVFKHSHDARAETSLAAARGAVQDPLAVSARSAAGANPTVSPTR